MEMDEATVNKIADAWTKDEKFRSQLRTPQNREKALQSIGIPIDDKVRKMLREIAALPEPQLIKGLEKRDTKC